MGKGEGPVADGAGEGVRSRRGCPAVAGNVAGTWEECGGDPAAVAGADGGEPVGAGAGDAVLSDGDAAGAASIPTAPGLRRRPEA